MSHFWQKIAFAASAIMWDFHPGVFVNQASNRRSFNGMRACRASLPSRRPISRIPSSCRPRSISGPDATSRIYISCSPLGNAAGNFPEHLIEVDLSRFYGAAGVQHRGPCQAAPGMNHQAHCARQATRVPCVARAVDGKPAGISRICMCSLRHLVKTLLRQNGRSSFHILG